MYMTRAKNGESGVTQVVKGLAGAMALLALLSGGCDGDDDTGDAGDTGGVDAGADASTEGEGESTTGGKDTGKTGGKDDGKTGGKDDGKTGGKDDGKTGGKDDGKTGGDTGGESGDDTGGETGGEEEVELMPVWVGSGANHLLVLSIDDGQTWCVTNESDEEFEFEVNPHLLRNVSYGDGWFVAGSETALFRSENGYDWEDVLAEQGRAVTGTWIGQVAYGNDWWVAVGNFGTAMRSQDLVEWEDVSSELDSIQSGLSLAFGDGVFVAGLQSEEWFESEDGTAWTKRDDGPAAVAFDGETFVADPGHVCDEEGEVCVGPGWMNTIKRSTDGGESFAPLEQNLFDYSLKRVARGMVPASDFGDDAEMPSSLRECLGL